MYFNNSKLFPLYLLIKSLVTIRASPTLRSWLLTNISLKHSTLTSTEPSFLYEIYPRYLIAFSAIASFNSSIEYILSSWIIFSKLVLSESLYNMSNFSILTYNGSLY